MVNTHISNVLLYTCTLQELNAGIVPTTLLPHSHPFCHLLLSYLQTLTSMGKYDSVIDALIAVSIGDAKWRSKSSPKRIVTCRGAIRKLLIERTPKFAMVEQNFSNGYGFHRRTKVHENFIFVTKEYIDMLCGAKNDSYKQLAIEALLKATVNHELAHWLFTQRVGPFHPDYLDALSHSLTQSREALMKLSPQPLSENMAKYAPKDLRAVWEDDEGEAGNYVEVHSQGGIISFDHDMGIANIQTEAKVQYILTRPYLLKFREGYSIRFVPPKGVPQCPTQASPQRPKAGTFFPHVDTCYHPTPQSFQPVVGLGIAGINPSSMCAWRRNGELISFCQSLGCYPHIISARKMTDEILSHKKEESVVE
ncbi:hypothetical protein JOM56_007973 [Amanita muscaria]